MMTGEFKELSGFDFVGFGPAAPPSDTPKGPKEAKQEQVTQTAKEVLVGEKREFHSSASEVRLYSIKRGIERGVVKIDKKSNATANVDDLFFVTLGREEEKEGEKPLATLAVPKEIAQKLKSKRIHIEGSDKRGKPTERVFHGSDIKVRVLSKEDTAMLYSVATKLIQSYRETLQADKKREKEREQNLHKKEFHVIDRESKPSLQKTADKASKKVKTLQENPSTVRLITLEKEEEEEAHKEKWDKESKERKEEEFEDDMKLRKQATENIHTLRNEEARQNEEVPKPPKQERK